MSCKPILPSFQEFQGLSTLSARQTALEQVMIFVSILPILSTQSDLVYLVLLSTIQVSKPILFRTEQRYMQIYKSANIHQIHRPVVLHSFGNEIHGPELEIVF